MQHMTMRQNPLTGDWLCAIDGTNQCYACGTKRDAQKFCADVNADIDAGNILIVGGHLQFKRWLVVRDPKTDKAFITPDISKRKLGRIICTLQTQAEAEAYLRWLETPAADSPF